MRGWGPFTLIEIEEGRGSRTRRYKATAVCTRSEVGCGRSKQYGILRAQALTPRESLALVEKFFGER